MKIALRVATAATLLCMSFGMPVSADPMIPLGEPTQAKDLHAVKTERGFDLSGALLSSNTCMDTRFSPLPIPDSYVADQYKRPGSGPMCGFIATWKKTNISVVERDVPSTVHVHVAGGQTIDVPIQRP